MGSMDSSLDHSGLISAHGATHYNPGLPHPSAPFYSNVPTYPQLAIQTGQLPQPQSPPGTYGAHYQPNQRHGYPPSRDYRYANRHLNIKEPVVIQRVSPDIMQEPLDSYAPKLPGQFPVLMLDVQLASQEHPPNERHIQPDAFATYAAYHPHNPWWYEPSLLHYGDLNPGIVSEYMNPSGQLPNPNEFVSVNISSVHQSAPTISNPSPPSTTASAGPVQSVPSTSIQHQGVPGVAGGQRFECEDCHKIFDRISRLDNCRNRHLGIRPWQCGGRCGDPSCEAKYACVDYLQRHLLSHEERCARCPKCHHNISKQNMARHRESCV